MIYDIYYDLSQEKRVSTAQKMKSCIKDFFSKCDQIPKNLGVWAQLLEKSLMENPIFCALEYDFNMYLMMNIHF